MKVRILENRRVILEKDNDAGTQFENFATTLQFEFPEYVEKNGQPIATNTLNKYIVFEIDSNNNTDLIINNNYSIPYVITKLKKVSVNIQLKEPTNNDDMSDKLIWISDSFLLSFDKSKESSEPITQEEIDAFNTLYSQLNALLVEVNALKEYQEQFKRDVEAGKYDGKDGKDGEDGYTPVKGVDYFTPQEIAEIEGQVETSVLTSQTITDIQDSISTLNTFKQNVDNTPILIKEREGGND